jgi:hypothetical protein
MPAWAKIGALGGLGLAVVIYLIMFIMSASFAQQAIDALQV